MARERPPSEIGAKKAYDERLYRRGPRGLSRIAVGAIMVALIAIGTYLAFAKSIPFVGKGYEAKAVFQNAATLRKTSPVRIAGVNVGEVTSVEADGDTTEVTFTVDDDGLPLHTDATIDIRPRLFLEGNFFLDTHPGSPSAPELPDGGTIPVTQTSTAVQLDQVLTTLQKPDRENLGRFLEGFGTGLNHKPTAQEDQTQDPDVQGESGAQAVNDSFTYGGPAGRDSAIVNEALLGAEPHDLSRLIRGNRRIFGALLSREEQLKDLITNFNTFTGALATESENLSATVRELAPTLEIAQPSLRHLSESLPPLRSFARTLEPSIAELPGTIDASGPWLRQTNKLLRKGELGGLSKILRQTQPNLASATHTGIGLLRQNGLLGLCGSDVLVPTGNVVIDSAGGAYPFSTGQPNFREFWYTAAQQAGVGGNFSGNGSYLRVQPGGGDLWTRTNNPDPTNPAQNGTLFSRTISAPIGTRPNLPASPKPPFETGRACHKNPVPDLNGTGGTGLAGDIGPPQPEVTPAP
jgi:phospholipid/cholesterol/gamma-HCH transport system substrate-binding protein